ncbi:unnamed protein product [Adineta steineri]|uniref:Uncharacterized protein n=1 Tax=Adineta steineri TaxID=433720 RepID=A0A813M4G7_9BILA|nr:unnamed protein product [Adineta steineri]CAF1349585.1 unnamed protein product [Adineta steineri]CAF3672259.1 unnamed protein product [Adineta steineri]
MGSRGKLFCAFSPAFIIPIANFAVGIGGRDSKCPIYPGMKTNLIGSGIAEFFFLLFLTYFIHRLASGYDKIEVSKKTYTYSDGSQKVKVTKTSELKAFAGKIYHY